MVGQNKLGKLRKVKKKLIRKSNHYESLVKKARYEKLRAERLERERQIRNEREMEKRRAEARERQEKEHLERLRKQKELHWKEEEAARKKIMKKRQERIDQMYEHFHNRKMQRKDALKNESLEVDFYVDAAGKGLGANSNTWPQRKPRVYYKRSNIPNNSILRPPKNVSKLFGFENKEDNIRKPGRSLKISKKQWDQYDDCNDMFDLDGKFVGRNSNHETTKKEKKGGRSL